MFVFTINAHYSPVPLAFNLMYTLKASFCQGRGFCVGGVVGKDSLISSEGSREVKEACISGGGYSRSPLIAEAEEIDKLPLILVV